MSTPESAEKPHDVESPPVFKRWSSWYVLVISIMVIQLLVYLWITLSFS